MTMRDRASIMVHTAAKEVILNYVNELRYASVVALFDAIADKRLMIAKK
jgi:hypothetical protein